MFRRVRSLRVQTTFVRLTSARKISAFHQLLEGKPAPMSIKPFKESITAVRVTDEKLEEAGQQGVFASDEEPHFLKPDQGFGFNPLKLGEHLVGGQTHVTTYEIVRKLGFGANSSVWLVNCST